MTYAVPAELVTLFRELEDGRNENRGITWERGVEPRYSSCCSAILSCDLQLMEERPIRPR